MQPETVLENDIEIQNQSNACLTFCTADRINLKDVVNIEKISTLVKVKRIIAFMRRFKSNLLSKFQVNHIPAQKMKFSVKDFFSKCDQ